jgi:hypothetical protein
VRDRIPHLARTTYAGFNDHHLCEKLVEKEGFCLGRETLRRLLRSSGNSENHRLIANVGHLPEVASRFTSQGPGPHRLGSQFMEFQAQAVPLVLGISLHEIQPLQRGQQAVDRGLIQMEARGNLGNPYFRSVLAHVKKNHHPFWSHRKCNRDQVNMNLYFTLWNKRREG